MSNNNTIKSSPARRALPDRRLNETRRIDTSDGATLFLTIGYDPQSPVKPKEVFYSNGFKSGSQLEFQAHDICVLLSLMLQSGWSAVDLVKSLAQRDKFDRTVEYASLTGLIAHELTKPPSWSGQHSTATH